jgi:hypothetical protein
VSMRVQERGILLVAAMIVALALSGCSAGPRTTGQALSSGRTVRIISVAPMTFPESGPALILKYQTDLKVDQMTPLTQEVDEIWTDFKPQVEKAGFNGAAITAEEVPSGWPIYHSNAYTFVYTRQSDGTWQRLSSESTATGYVGHYTKPGNATDYTDLKPDGTFAVLDRGQSLSGTYKVSGHTVTLVVSGQGSAQGEIQPGKLVDNDGQTWVKAARK